MLKTEKQGGRLSSKPVYSRPLRSSRDEIQKRGKKEGNRFFQIIFHCPKFFQYKLVRAWLRSCSCSCSCMQNTTIRRLRCGPMPNQMPAATVKND